MLERARTTIANLERANGQQKVSINRLLGQIEELKGERQALIQILVDIRYVLKFQPELTNKEKVGVITRYIEEWEK